MPPCRLCLLLAGLTMTAGVARSAPLTPGADARVDRHGDAPAGALLIVTAPTTRTLVPGFAFFRAGSFSEGSELLFFSNQTRQTEKSRVTGGGLVGVPQLASLAAIPPTMLVPILEIASVFAFKMSGVVTVAVSREYVELTEDKYAMSEVWWTPCTDLGNYGAGSLRSD